MMMTAAQLMDVRQLEGSDCRATILEAFDALAPGASLVVVSPHEPRGLLRRLQTERKGMFEWSPLGTGPSRFRTAIARRAASAGPQDK